MFGTLIDDSEELIIIAFYSNLELSAAKHELPTSNVLIGFTLANMIVAILSVEPYMLFTLKHWY